MKKGQKLWVWVKSGECSADCFTCLVDCCASAGVSYRMAKAGKRQFKDILLQQITVVKCAGKRREGAGEYESNFKRYADNKDFDDSI